MTSSIGPDISPFLDPAVAAATGKVPFDFNTLDDETLPSFREQMRGRPSPPATDVRHSDVVIDDESGLNVRVHRADDHSEPAPGIVWIHGGGFVLGDAAGDDARFDRWCKTLGVVGVSVNYRLAPEHPYPVPLLDCVRAVEWVRANADDLGVDPGKIGLGGGSAGGGLAAGTTLRLRDENRPVPDFLVLHQPMLDDRAETVSASWEDPAWPPAGNRYGWNAYLGSLSGSEVPQYAAAARAEDLSGLPPTYVSVGALDSLSDAAIAFANRLRHAGIAAELHVYPGATHSFESMAAGAPVARRSVAALEAWLADVLRGDN